MCFTNQGLHNVLTLHLFLYLLIQHNIFFKTPHFFCQTTNMLKPPQSHPSTLSQSTQALGSLHHITNSHWHFTCGNAYISMQKDRLLDTVGEGESGDLPQPGIEPGSPALLVYSLLSEPAAASTSLQSCPTLCDPIDGSPPGSSVPGILQARTPEWVAISFSNA